MLPGQTLTVVLQIPCLAATAGAFALWCRGGGVLTWGDAYTGGDSSSVQDQLRGVQEVVASKGAFAAILVDGQAAILEGVFKVVSYRFCFAP